MMFYDNDPSDKYSPLVEAIAVVALVALGAYLTLMKLNRLDPLYRLVGGAVHLVLDVPPLFLALIGLVVAGEIRDRLERFRG